MTNLNLESAVSIGSKSHPEKSSPQVAPCTPPRVVIDILREIDLNTRISNGHMGPEILPEDINTPPTS